MSLAARLAAEIRTGGPISVERYMSACIEAYYASRDPFGRGGDFVTAPEISQMFGELIGLWTADLWQRAGTPQMHLVELGPGRGTLMADLLRAARRVPGFAGSVDVHFIETSPALRAAQAERIPDAAWHETIASVPADAPMLVIGNEFFDALPVQQWVLTSDEWVERRVALDGERLAFSPVGEAIREESPARDACAAELARRLAAQGGAALIVDYGYGAAAGGDTLQAVKDHKPVDPLAHPGESDLTAHVDFAALAAAASNAGAIVSPLATQQTFLTALGIEQRCERLCAGLDAEAAHAISGAMRRLTAPQAMGGLFKVLVLRSPGWPDPAGVPQ